MLGSATGIAMPSEEVLERFHPQFALAIDCGVEAHPVVYPLTETFSAAAVGDFQPASFDEFISSYAVFAGCFPTIDPTNTFPGNVLKTLSDGFQVVTSGITFTMTVRGRGNDYSPIFVDIPLQSVPAVLNGTAGMWHLNNPQNVKARFTIAAAQPAANLTVWLLMAFIQLGEGAEDYLCMSAEAARQELCKRKAIRKLLADKAAAAALAAAGG